MAPEIPEIMAAKYLVELGDLAGLQVFVRDEISQITTVNFAYVFQKIYIHACLKQQALIAKWLLEECYVRLNPMDQIVVRPSLAYGRALLAKRTK